MIYIVSFFILGTIVGGQINHCIYRFAFFRRRPISPWMAPPADATPRSVFDRIPLVGWTLLNREEPIHGSLFWLRPFLIELGTACAFAGMYLFHFEYGSGLPADVELAGGDTTRWLALATQLTLFTLLAIATFIDFDEFMIPDQVTVPGVLILLSIAAATQYAGLPTIETGIAVPLTFAAPGPYAAAFVSWLGNVLAILGIWFWCFALVPKTCALRRGLGGGLRIMIASVRRPARKTSGTISVRPRRPYTVTWVLAGIAVVAPIAVTIFWWTASDTNRISFLTAVAGMVFGMSMIWSIRIVGKMALQTEAMGFGDVTLMAMIGAYVGWQACLPILAISALVALVFTLPMAALRWMTALQWQSSLPYGPYLSIGTVVVILAWNPVWEGYLKNLFDVFGAANVFLVLAGMTVPMFILLVVTRFVKERIFGFES